MTPFHETSPTGPAAELAHQMQSLIPVLETERLILRAPRIEDFDDFADAATGARGIHYGDYDDREGAWGDFIQLTGTWMLRGHGVWTVTDRTDGKVLGFVQIGAEPGDREPELGFLVTAQAEGRGIAREAARAVRAHAFGTLGLASLVSYVDPKNARSNRLALRLGATRDAQAEAAFADDPIRVYRHPKPEARP